VATGKRAFKVDARALLSLGRESIKDHTTALVELIKNAYDADADHVEVDVIGEDDLIRIADDGEGMNSEDINSKWLRIGFSEKRTRRVSHKGRRETGEKGIGRLSADRLGAQLRLQSQKLDEPAVGVSVNWNEFDVEGKEIGAVPVAEVPSPRPNLPAKSAGKKGTEILIGQLRQEWTASDIKTLETELSTLVPPDVAKTDFAIWLRTERGGEYRRISSSFEEGAELEFRGSFDSKGQLTYEISERPAAPGQKRRTIKHGKIPWAQHVPAQSDKQYSLGRFSVVLSFFLRQGVSLAGFSLGQLKEYLDTYGGVRIYRDNIRVKPYGDPNHSEGDWLGLSERRVKNPAGAGRKDYRIAANQLVGAVYIGRDLNPALADSAAREGLVHGDAYSAFHAAVFGCVVLLETTYHQRFVEKKGPDAPEPKVDLPVVVGEIKTEIAEVTKNLAKVDTEEMRVASTRLLTESVAKLEAVAKKVAIAGREIHELANQATVYRGLATVGIAAAVFGHETESALAQAKLSTGLAFAAIDRDAPKIPLSKKELVKAQDAVERVQVWGQFALARVKKDKRRRTRVDVSELVSRLVDEMAPLFEASTIVLNHRVQKDVQIRGFAMDFEALLVNLLTNAYHAAKLAKRNRQVLVSLNVGGRGDSRTLRLSVADSGPGITKEHLSQIWTPLFSTRVDDRGRPNGTGLGLTIVKSIADDMQGAVMALPKGDLGGATVEVSVPYKGGVS
jgi:hypothetical protein